MTLAHDPGNAPVPNPEPGNPQFPSPDPPKNPTPTPINTPPKA